MLYTDETPRYARNTDGYFIGQQMDGTGTFGDWALARVQTDKNRFVAIERIRSMTDEEINRMLAQPILYWFLLAHPRINPSTNSWALMVFKFDPYATTSRVIYTSRGEDDLTSKVAV